MLFFIYQYIYPHRNSKEFDVIIKLINGFVPEVVSKYLPLFQILPDYSEGNIFKLFIPKF